MKSEHDTELKTAVDKRRATLKKSGDGDKYGLLGEDNGGSEVTESESEWAKEREETRRNELDKIKQQGLAQVKAEENKRRENEVKQQQVDTVR